MCEKIADLPSHRLRFFNDRSCARNHSIIKIVLLVGALFATVLAIAAYVAGASPFITIPLSIVCGVTTCGVTTMFLFINPLQSLAQGAGRNRLQEEKESQNNPPWGERSTAEWDPSCIAKFEQPSAANWKPPPNAVPRNLLKELDQITFPDPTVVENALTLLDLKPEDEYVAYKIQQNHDEIIGILKKNIKNFSKPIAKVVERQINANDTAYKTLKSNFTKNGREFDPTPPQPFADVD